MELLSEVIEQISDNSSTHSQDSPDILHQEMNKALVDMMQQVDDIDGAMVCSVDGIAIAEHMQEGFDQHRFAAMSCALLALSETLAREGQKGSTQNVLIEGNSGKIFLMHAGEKMLLTVFAKDGSNLGMSLAFAKQAAEKIECLAQLSA
jgi:predicted regulator of Ras-like GTPase activity (Roadblock/LC7/MglB family)